MDDAPIQILLIEDDEGMRSLLTRSLERRGMRVKATHNGMLGLQLWRTTQPDVVLLDLSLPGMDGLDVLSMGRRSGLRTPVLVITSRATVGDRILGLNAGADDYLVKPFDLDELHARVRVLSRRSSAVSTPPMQLLPQAAGVVAAGDLRYEPGCRLLYTYAGPLDLSPREHAVLEILIQRRGQPVPKNRIHELVFGQHPDIALNAVEVIIYRLRKKLRAWKVKVTNLKSVGYFISDA